MAAADEFRTSTLTADRQSEVVRSAAVSASYFSLFDVSAQLGRTFRPGEDQPGQDHVVILSHEFWERRFASDSSLIGRTIRLNRETYTVIGVMPANFRLLGYAIQLWTPLTITPSDQTAAARKDRSLHVYARLKPGVTIEQARPDLDTLAHRAQESFPDIEKGWGVSARTLPDFLLYDFGIGNGLAILMMTVGFVLLIACTNVAGLLLARAAGRRKELAIRRALGAGRHRLIRQLLIEGMLIAFLGGGVGLLLSRWGIALLAAQLQFNEAIRTVEIRLDWTVLLFTTVVSLLCALLCALAPALNASRTDITTNLKDDSRAASASRSHARLRTVLVMGEIAMAMFLLVGAGLLIRGVLRIEHQSLGFRADHLLTAGITLDAAHYKDTSQQTLFVRDLISRVSQLPGAESVSITSDLPATGPATVPVRIKGEPDLPQNQVRNALDVLVTPNFFHTSTIPLLRGRTFTDTDDTASPHVVLVNQEFVNHYLPNQEPLGKQIRLDVSGNAPVWREIVGVVSNVKTFSESTRDEPQAYEPFFQRPVNSFSVMIRTASDPAGFASALRNTVAQMDAELPLAQVMTMEAVVEQQHYGDPLFVRLMGSFALMALTLSSIGIYGLIAYSVGQRIHEIGIRMALGARSQDILGMVLRRLAAPSASRWRYRYRKYSARCLPISKAASRSFTWSCRSSFSWLPPWQPTSRRVAPPA